MNRKKRSLVKTIVNEIPLSDNDTSKLIKTLICAITN